LPAIAVVGLMTGGPPYAGWIKMKLGFVDFTRPSKTFAFFDSAGSVGR
jgi:hypothetical protein